MPKLKCNKFGRIGDHLQHIFSQFPGFPLDFVSYCNTENLLFYPITVFEQGGFIYLLPFVLSVIFLAFPLILLESQLGKQFK